MFVSSIVTTNQLNQLAPFVKIGLEPLNARGIKSANKHEMMCALNSNLKI